MANQISFTAKVEKSPRTGGWHYVGLSSKVIEEIRIMSGKNGNVPVLAAIGNTIWQSTIMSRGNQQWYVALKAEVRTAESIFEGEMVKVRIEPDWDRIKK
ncbi:MAG: DUF1905 domain-containing protein [bacterium]|nr:DUF1905 domain-containing protein [bacterium]